LAAGFANDSLTVKESNEPWFGMFVEVASIIAIVIGGRQMKARQKGAFTSVDSLTFKKRKPKRNFPFWDFVKSR
jgi:hypothetical protein